MPPPLRKPAQKVPPRNLPPDHPNRQKGLRYQPNQLFESVEEIQSWIKLRYTKQDQTVRIIKTWEVKRVACQIEVEYYKK